MPFCAFTFYTTDLFVVQLLGWCLLWKLHACSFYVTILLSQYRLCGITWHRKFLQVVSPSFFTTCHIWTIFKSVLLRLAFFHSRFLCRALTYENLGSAYCFLDAGLTCCLESFSFSDSLSSHFISQLVISGHFFACEASYLMNALKFFSSKFSYFFYKMKFFNHVWSCDSFTLASMCLWDTCGFH